MLRATMSDAHSNPRNSRHTASNHSNLRGGEALLHGSVDAGRAVRGCTSTMTSRLVEGGPAMVAGRQTGRAELAPVGAPPEITRASRPRGPAASRRVASRQQRRRRRGPHSDPALPRPGLAQAAARPLVQQSPIPSRVQAASARCAMTCVGSSAGMRFFVLFLHGGIAGCLGSGQVLGTPAMAAPRQQGEMGARRGRGAVRPIHATRHSRIILQLLSKIDFLGNNLWK